MDQELTEMIETLLVAQVLTLAKAIEAERRQKGSASTDHYIPEAAALVGRERQRILALLAQSR